MRPSYFDQEFEQSFSYHFEEGGKVLAEEEVPSSENAYLVIDGAYGISSLVSDGTLSLPSSVRSETLGRNFEVRGIGKRAFQSLDSVEKVVLPAGLEFIGEEAFSSCPSLKEVEFDGDSVLSYIGKDAFSSSPFALQEREGDFYLGKVLFKADKDKKGKDSVPEGTLSIAPEAFEGSLYDQIDLPDSLQTVGEKAFSDMPSLTSIDLRNASSEGNVFLNTPLESLTYPGDVPALDLGLNSLKEAGLTGKRPAASVLKDQKNLTGVDLSGVEFLLPGSFENDTEITSVTGTESLKFSGDSYLLTSTVYGKNLPDGDVYLGTSYLGTKGDSVPSLKENTTGISGGSFVNKGLKDLPKGLLGIGAGSLKGNSFTDLSFASLEYLGDGAFGDCADLNSFSVPSDCVLGSSPLKGCLKVSSLSVPSSYSCSDLFGTDSSDSLVSLELKGEGSVKENAYAGCTALTEVKLLDGAEAVGKEAFSDCSSLEEVSLPDSLLRIEVHAFAGDSSLKKVNFSADTSLVSLEGFVFQDCTSLSTFGWTEGKILFPPSLRKCGSCVFRNCTPVGEVTVFVPSSYEENFSLSVSPYAFSGDWNFDPARNLRLPYSVDFVS